MKQVLHNPEVDALLNDKLTTEQQDALKDFKNVIYEAERKKAESKKWIILGLRNSELSLLKMASSGGVIRLQKELKTIL